MGATFHVVYNLENRHVFVTKAHPQECWVRCSSSDRKPKTQRHEGHIKAHNNSKSFSDDKSTTPRPKLVMLPLSGRVRQSAYFSYAKTLALVPLPLFHLALLGHAFLQNAAIECRPTNMLAAGAFWNHLFRLAAQFPLFVLCLSSQRKCEVVCRFLSKAGVLA